MSSLATLRVKRRLAKDDDVPKTKDASPTRSSSTEGFAPPTATDKSSDQSYMQSVLGYQPRGTALGRLTDAQRRVVDVVLSTYDIPGDFEVDKVKYGPLSGTTFEERVLTAWRTNLLPLKDGMDDPPTMCLDCGEDGHDEYHCPKVFE